MSYNSVHTQSVLEPRFTRRGTEYDELDEAFGTTSMMLFQIHSDLMGNSKFDDAQILVGYVRCDGVLCRAAQMIGYKHAMTGPVTGYLKTRLRKLNGETAYRIIRAINRAKAVQGWDDPSLWRQAACFEPTPVLEAYMQEQLATGTGPVQYFNRMGGPNAAKDVFKAALRISERSYLKNTELHRKHVVTTALEISDAKYEELLDLYNLRKATN
jgi:hypothetical protein